MHLTSHGITDPGKTRHANEDAMLVDPANQVFAVADGLGGLPGGADTSRRIIELLEQAEQAIDAATGQPNLEKRILRIHRIVAGEGIEAHPFTGSGSTLTLAQITGDQLWIGHVGDSAAYLLQRRKLHKLTIDHTFGAENPNVLTQCLGQNNADPTVEQTRVTVTPGDRLLLCSDGLNKVVSIDAIQTMLQLQESPAAICQKLIDAANACGGPDNITAIVVCID